MKSYYSRSPGRELNLGPHEYGGVLTTQPLRSAREE